MKDISVSSIPDQTIISQYNSCIENLFSLGRFGIKPGLEIIRFLLDGLKNPEKKFRSIHIAGTNGKGSTAATIASILSSSGIRTGLFTSPHLIRFNERIRIDGKQITDEEVVEAYEKVKKVDTGERPATFFEYATAMAFQFFSEKNVEFAVIETGMGGRLDSTNVIEPAACIITNISMDHEAFLGDSIQAIAEDKSGIIKRGIPLITGARNKEAIEIIERESRKKKAPFFKIGQDFDLKRNNDGTFRFIGMHDYMIDSIEPGLNGDHQIENTAIAIAALRVIRDKRVNKETIIQGIKDTKWPGRIEIIHKNPEIIIDGAHNPEAAEKLASYFEKYHPAKKISLIIGMMKDKDQSKTLHHLTRISSKIIATESKSPRAEKAENITHLLEKRFGIMAIAIPEIESAIEYAINESKNNELICITGSLYIVGEAKAHFEGIGFQTAPN